MEGRPDTCRTCLGAAEAMSSLYDSKEGSALAVKDMIMSIASITIREDDDYSKMICSKCLSEVLIAHSFKINCEESDRALRLESQEIGKYEDIKIESLPNLTVPKSEIEESTDEEPLKTEPADEDDLPLTNLTTEILIKSFNTDATSNADCPKNNIEMRRVTRCEKKKKIKTGISKNKLQKLYECSKCRAVFKNKRTLRKHSLTVHGVYPMRKSNASENTPDRDSGGTINFPPTKLRGENESHPTSTCDKSSYDCASCAFSCKTFRAFEKHSRRHTGEKPILCDECDYRCSYVAALVKHKRTHSGDKPYACEVCPYRTTTSYALRIHATTHTPDKPYACSACTFTCKLSTSLTQHIARRHDRRKDYACDTCGKCFFSSYHCKIHKRVHTGERPYACDKCGMAFSQKSNLEKHANLIHDGAPQKYPCGSCDYVARSRYTLKNHETKHSGERPLKCDMCNYCCITSSALKLHRQRHTGDARYNCEMCDYKCYTAGRLKAHKRKHTGERPYPCDLCEYRAKTDSGLRCHKLSHTNEQKYSCTNCLYKTNYRSNLTKHELKLCGRTAKQSTKIEQKPAILKTNNSDNSSQPTEIRNNPEESLN